MVLTSFHSAGTCTPLIVLFEYPCMDERGVKLIHLPTNESSYALTCFNLGYLALIPDICRLKLHVDITTLEVLLQV